PGAFWLLGSWVPQTLLNCLSAAFFAFGASRFLIESRRTGELELLLTTPLGAKTFIHDHWRALRLAVRWPLVVIIVAILLQFTFAATSRRSYGASGDWLLQYAISCAFAILNAMLSVFTTTQVGLWFGMKASTQGRAIAYTVLLAKGVPS